MSSTENSKPVVNCVLEAPPSPETSSRSPTLTNLDRSTWYNLRLEKQDETLFNAQLSVEIQLKLHPIFISKNRSEKNQFKSWKRLHPYETLFDVKSGNQIVTVNNDDRINVEDDDNDDYVHCVKVNWNSQNRELPLKICFNCVSSQFRNFPIFLVVRVEKKSNSEIYNSFCQIKLFWRGLAEQVNAANGNESEESDSEETINGHTNFIPYNLTNAARQVENVQNNDLNVNLFDQMQQTQNDLETISSDSINREYLQYIFEAPDGAYLETIPNDSNSVKRIFIKQNEILSIKIKPCQQFNDPIDKNLAIIKCELQKQYQSFSANDQTNWLNHHSQLPMIELDYAESRFTSKILDVRMLNFNQIEIVMIPNSNSEEIVAFKIHCLSKDFVENPNEDMQMPFNFSIRCIQQSTMTNLGESSFQVFTSDEDSSEQMIQKWLLQNSSEQNLGLSIPNFRIFGLLAIVFLFLACFMPLYGSKNANEIDFKQIESKIMEKLNMEFDRKFAEQSIDYEKIDRVFQAKLDLELKKFERTVQILIQDKINTKLKLLTEEKIDSNVTDQIIKETIHRQFSNISLSTIEVANIERIVDDKLKSLNDVSLDGIPNENTFDFSSNDVSDDVLIFLGASTSAGIANGYPTLTNLDRSAWYDLKLKKLDKNLANDKLLVSFHMELNLSKPSENLLHEWKTLHPNQRLFDLEYVKESTIVEKSLDTNEIILDNNPDYIDLASFYWNFKQMANLRIRFNVVHSQFPFKRSKIIPSDVTFYLHVKISSLTKSIGAMIDASFCQIKVFWPNGAAVANHKANQLLLHAQPYDDLAPSLSYTRLVSRVKQTKHTQTELVEDSLFMQTVKTLLETDEVKIALNNQNYLHYILNNPAESFLNVTMKTGEQFKGFFLEQNSPFAIKFLANSKTSVEMSNSIVRTRFELSLNSRSFNDEELLNWQASKKESMIEIDYLESKLSDMVYDIRQIDVKCIEIIWLPKLDLMLHDFVVAFKLNTQNSEIPILFQIKTFMIKNEDSVRALDFASSQILLTEVGQARICRNNWLQQNVNHNSQSKTTLSFMNDLIISPNSKSKSSSTFYDIITTVIKFIVRWAVRCILAALSISYGVNVRRGKFPTWTTTEKAQGIAILVALLAVICVTFIV